MKKSQHNKLEILYKDKWIVVINKPAGLLSVSFSGHKGHTAQSIVEEILRKQGLVNAKHKPFSVHRLDRDTSGVMMFAFVAWLLIGNFEKNTSDGGIRPVATFVGPYVGLIFVITTRCPQFWAIMIHHDCAANRSRKTNKRNCEQKG